MKSVSPSHDRDRRSLSVPCLLLCVSAIAIAGFMLRLDKLRDLPLP
jgi:hypothetical protein